MDRQKTGTNDNLRTYYEMVQITKVNHKTKQKVIESKCVQEYNCNMGAVDRTDMMILNVESIRRTQRWYEKLYFYLVDLAIINSHALYLCHLGKKPTLPQFHLEVVCSVLRHSAFSARYSSFSTYRDRWFWIVIAN